MRYVPRVLVAVSRIWQPHPVSEAYASALGTLYGHGIDGQAGTISTGAGRRDVGAVADPAAGWTGNTYPPQLFAGWNPRAQTKTGTIITSPGGLPATSLPIGSGSPMDSAMAQIMQGPG